MLPVRPNLVWRDTCTQPLCNPTCTEKVRPPSQPHIWPWSSEGSPSQPAVLFVGVLLLSVPIAGQLVLLAMHLVYRSRFFRVDASAIKARVQAGAADKRQQVKEVMEKVKRRTNSVVMTPQLSVEMSPVRRSPLSISIPSTTDGLDGLHPTSSPGFSPSPLFGPAATTGAGDVAAVAGGVRPGFVRLPSPVQPDTEQWEIKQRVIVSFQKLRYGATTQRHERQADEQRHHEEGENTTSAADRCCAAVLRYWPRVLTVEDTLAVPAPAVAASEPHPIAPSGLYATYVAPLLERPPARCILNSLTGSMRSGELVALLGTSGCGKSTLIELLAGRKTSGEMDGSITIKYAPAMNTVLSFVQLLVCVDWCGLVRLLCSAGIRFPCAVLG